MADICYDLWLEHVSSNNVDKIPIHKFAEINHEILQDFPSKWYSNKDKLFNDTLNPKNDLQVFCESEEYDTEAIYEDLYLEDDPLNHQSNIYQYVKNTSKYSMNYYYFLKHKVAKYLINPIDANYSDQWNKCIVYRLFRINYLKLDVLLREKKLSNEDRIENVIDFYNKLREVDNSLDLKDETKTGYIILHSRVLSASPVIFCENMKTVFDILKTSEYQGTLCEVVVTGKFLQMSSCFAYKYNDLFMVIIPTDIQIVQQCKDSQNSAKVREISDLIQMIRYDNKNDFRRAIKKAGLLLMNKRILKDLFRLHSIYGTDKWVTQLLFEYAIKSVDFMTELLFSFKKLDFDILNNKMNELCCGIWLEFIKDDNIDNMSILKLKKSCKELKSNEHLDVNKQNIQFFGQMLLEYETNSVLNQIFRNIKRVEWEKNIKSCLFKMVFETKHEKVISLPMPKIRPQKKIEKFLDIMYQYDKIINTEQKQFGDAPDMMMQSTNSKTTAGRFNANKIKKLFDFVDAQFNISQILDVVFYMQRENIAELKKIQQHYECKLKADCNILKNTIKTRECELLSRALKFEKYQPENRHQYLNMTLEDYSKMELLNLLHIRLFHKYMYRRKRAEVVAPKLQMDNGKLFKDTLNIDNLHGLQLFCESEEYDTEAIYEDLYPDNDSQSNIYDYFKHKLKANINHYYLLKQKIIKYSINPPDTNSNDRHLVELDFGNHVIDWNVDPTFYNMKQEWLENEYFPIGQDIIDTLCIKAKILAETERNIYGLSTDDILCIKTYTDTNELQGNFRHAFRTSSDDNRRSQFVHWATYMNITFIKIEISNELYQSNTFICNTTLYHGLDRLFNTKKLVNQFYGALSTTWEESVATNFAGGAGMILQIDKGINNKNVNAIEVDWISCHEAEKEVLLMNPTVLIQQSIVFLQDPELKSTHLKSILTSVVEDDDAFSNLSSFLQSSWIETCLEHTIKDTEFVERINLFTPQKYLHGMSLFEFIFFECAHYQIATYISKYCNK
eukprot:303997_1